MLTCPFGFLNQRLWMNVMKVFAMNNELMTYKKWLFKKIIMLAIVAISIIPIVLFVIYRETFPKHIKFMLYIILSLFIGLVFDPRMIFETYKKYTERYYKYNSKKKL
jgi:FlaA1/EpsC-like NDP-sugar epimerase